MELVIIVMLNLNLGFVYVIGRYIVRRIEDLEVQVQLHDAWARSTDDDPEDDEDDEDSGLLADELANIHRQQMGIRNDLLHVSDEMMKLQKLLHSPPLVVGHPSESEWHDVRQALKDEFDSRPPRGSLLVGDGGMHFVTVDSPVSTEKLCKKTEVFGYNVPETVMVSYPDGSVHEAPASEVISSDRPERDHG